MIFVIFTGAVSAANDTLSQGYNISTSSNDTFDHMVLLNNGSTNASTKNNTTKSSAEPTSTLSR